MKFTNSPAAPREAGHDHCDNGCRKDANDTYACRAKACGKDHLCKDCTWSCSECGLEFCEEHSTQIEESVFLCGPCLLQRNQRAERVRQLIVRDPINMLALGDFCEFDPKEAA